MLNRVPDAPSIKGSIIVNTLAAEIATFVMMEATKEKTRQVLALTDRNNSNFSLTVESAASVSNDESKGANIHASSSDFTSSSSQTETESASNMNPVIGFGPESI